MSWSLQYRLCISGVQGCGFLCFLWCSKVRDRSWGDPQQLVQMWVTPGLGRWDQWWWGIKTCLGSFSGDLWRDSYKMNESTGFLAPKRCGRKLLAPGDLSTWARGIWRDGACPLFLGSVRYQRIARLAGKLWPSESCRLQDNVLCSLSGWPFRDVLGITLVQGLYTGNALRAKSAAIGPRCFPSRESPSPLCDADFYTEVAPSATAAFYQVSEGRGRFFFSFRKKTSIFFFIRNGSAGKRLQFPARVLPGPFSAKISALKMSSSSESYIHLKDIKWGNIWHCHYSGII